MTGNANTDRPCLVMVAPNGARHSRKDHPALPVSATQCAADALACAENGANSIHLHARNGRGEHTLASHIVRSYWLAVERALDGKASIQLTTEAAGQYEREQQLDLIYMLKPSYFSMALREFLPKELEEDHNSVEEFHDFLTWSVRQSLQPQVILFSPEDVLRFHGLRDRGIIPEKVDQVLFVLGRYLQHADGELEPQALDPYLKAHQGRGRWMVCAFGRKEYACLEYAASLGGDVRVGFENSFYRQDGTIADSNATKVSEIVAMLNKTGRKHVYGRLVNS